MNSSMQLFAALILTAAFAISIWMLRKARFSALAWKNLSAIAPREPKLISRRSLTAQHTLHVVSIAGDTYIVATHPRGMHVLPLPRVQQTATATPRLVHEESE